MQVKAAGPSDGIELFPKQDRIEPNAIRQCDPRTARRSPGVNRRYWFYGAQHDLEAQMKYLRELRRVTERQLLNWSPALRWKTRTLASTADGHALRPTALSDSRPRESGRVAACWAELGHAMSQLCGGGRDRGKDNLAISVEEPLEVPVLGWLHKQTDPGGAWCACSGERALGGGDGERVSTGATEADDGEAGIPGIYCQTWVTAERQDRAKRWVLRGVESGGSAKEFGRYISFFAADGSRMEWLQKADRIGANGVHAVAIGEALVGVEMARVDETYQLVISRHQLGKPKAEGKRPPVESSVIFRGVDGQLSEKLRKQGLAPAFLTRSGEVKAVPSDFLEAVKIVTAGVSCVNCRHVHGLVGGACSAEEGPCGDGSSDRVLRELQEVRHSKEPEDEGVLDEALHVSVLGRVVFGPNERAGGSDRRAYRTVLLWPLYRKFVPAPKRRRIVVVDEEAEIAEETAPELAAK